MKFVKQSLLPPGWDPKLAGDEVLKRLITVTASQARGAHDAEMVLVGNYAYVVAEVNDIRSGERANWPFIYVAMSIVNLQTLAVEKIISVAKSDQAFANDVLPHGACFVPRIIQKDEKTLRCYFASENPDIRQSQTWFTDFDLGSQTFDNRIYKAKIKTADGVFDMQPQYFYADAAKYGFKKEAKDYGMYLFDSFKVFDGKTYIAINNYVGRQNGLAILNKAFDTFEIIAHFNEPQELQLCEPAINRLPDGTWMAIIRQNGGNYMFSTSHDGLTWTRGEYKDFVPNGENSKPTFDKFNGVYYLGWQESTHINGKGRTVFNVDISQDGKNWERKYRFEAPQSFQYPTFHEHNGSIWLTVTQGSTERIMFGKLEATR
ncbi:exo-alpha-sialidase [Spirosoma sp. HMF4905]|uniref:Exo-alpha-sialidase n=1 Tax=Spirosoma arboris TaxID=2682092 RepID=A0A7K1SNR4_9BACT|nr:exo-alpha-sialidase [Spirosoma arboris]